MDIKEALELQKSYNEEGKYYCEHCGMATHDEDCRICWEHITLLDENYDEVQETIECHEITENIIDDMKEIKRLETCHSTEI